MRWSRTLSRVAARIARVSLSVRVGGLRWGTSQGSRIGAESQGRRRPRGYTLAGSWGALMDYRRWRLAIGLAALAVFFVASAEARELTFEQRVRAQEAIERVYYSHQLGGTQPFEEAVSRETLEMKVRTYLKESV